MILFKKAKEATDFLTKRKKKGTRIGFVPTMGALHKGHISLIETSKNQNEITACSIFVNPSQFNDASDFEKYPITIENDIYLLEKAGCDMLFLPSVNEIYPDGLKSNHHYDLGYLEEILEGKFRPGHFQGVCQVVNRLLNIILTDNLYLGQKDYQQCMVVKRLIELLNLKINLIACPTLREEDGLAMSSRNLRLNKTERANVIKIYQALLKIRQELKPGNIIPLKEKAINYLNAGGFKVDYVEIANADNLNSVENWDGKTSLVALCAAFLNEVRLIDNMLLNKQ